MDHRASRASRKDVQGRNFMTPDLVQFEFIGHDTIAYEISQGHDIDNDVIYGFAVGLPVTDERRRKWSGCSRSLSQISEYLDDLASLV
jgi:hypothetical protein